MVLGSSLRVNLIWRGSKLVVTGPFGDGNGPMRNCCVSLNSRRFCCPLCIWAPSAVTLVTVSECQFGTIKRGSNMPRMFSLSLVKGGPPRKCLVVKDGDRTMEMLAFVVGQGGGKFCDHLVFLVRALQMGATEQSWIASMHCMSGNESLLAAEEDWAPCPRMYYPSQFSAAFGDTAEGF